MSGRAARMSRIPDGETIRAALDACQDAMCFVDPATGRVIHANTAAGAFFGFSEGEWQAVHLWDLVERKADLSGREGIAWTHGCVRVRDGRHAMVEWGLFDSASTTTAIAVFRTTGQFEAISESDRDPLTSLPNRTILYRRLLDLLRHKPNNFAVLFLDLDAFKAVNDRFGHVVGDQVLRRVAERLTCGLRPTDAVARYGGDEFVVLLDGIEDPSVAIGATRRLLDSIAAPLVVEGHTFRIRASVGLVLDARHPTDPQEVIRAADCAMYQAKRVVPGSFVVSSVSGQAPCCGIPRDIPRR
ncbi:MAG: diguanylate cyclase domain-containing protein [Thermoguttaceae bacterium]